MRWITFRAMLTGVTIHGRVRFILPSTTYTAWVSHAGHPNASRVITVTTAAASALAAGQQGGSNPFFPDWPVSIDTPHLVTDDPYDWRGHRYHAGLDIGSTALGEHVRSASVVAAADGVVRVFNDQWPDAGDPNLPSVFYCPGLTGALHSRFITGDGPVSRNGKPCHHLVTAYSGRTALVFHDLGSRGWYVTKYAHLRTIDSRLRTQLDRNRDGIADPGAWTPIGSGDPIGEVGASGQADDPVLKSNGVACHPGDICYVTVLTLADGRVCYSNLPRGPLHCYAEALAAARAADAIQCKQGARCEEAFTDPHLHFEVRLFGDDAGEHWYASALGCAGTAANSETQGRYCEYSPGRQLSSVEDPEALLRPLPASPTPRDPSTGTRIQNANADRYVFEIASAAIASIQSTSHLSIGLSTAFWRPAFYSRHMSGKPRERWPGIRGTRPGVEGYYTNASCAAPRLDIATPLVYLDDDVPTSEGAIPRATRTLTLSSGVPCHVSLYTSNSPYPAREIDPLAPDPQLHRGDIELHDPSVAVTWVADLGPDTDSVRSEEELRGNALHLYTFKGYRGVTYRFCTYPSSARVQDCVHEDSPTNVAQMVIVGSNGVVRNGISRDASGLQWSIPASAAGSDTYALIVRRRQRVTDTSVADYGYRFKYTIPSIPTCTSDDPTDACLPPAPAIDTNNLSRTSASLTFRWLESTGASGYEVRLDDGEAQEPNMPDGAGNRSHSFGNLSASQEYRIGVRAINAFDSSGWTETRVSTLQRPAPPPPPQRPPRPPDTFEDREVVQSSWTAWEVEGDGIVICYFQHYRYERYVIETWFTTHTWSGARWVPSTSLFHTSSELERRTPLPGVRPTPCIVRSEGDSPSGASSDPQQYLLAGEYVFAWGDVSVGFTVPDDT